MNPLLWVPPALVLGSPPAQPPGLGELLDRIPRVAGGGGGVDPEEQALARRIQAFGGAAAPAVLALLEHPDARIRSFAGYVLRDLPDLPESALEALMKARRAGDGWIPPAIARIGTPRAIAFLVEDLGARPEPHTQVTGALAQAGAKAAPGLARLLRRPEAPTADLQWPLSTVFSDMADGGACAVPHLAQVAEDGDVHPEYRMVALGLLRQIGRPSAVALPVLLRLARSEAPQVAQAAQAAIEATGTAEALPGLLGRLDGSLASRSALGQLARMGPAAEPAGPRVAAQLEALDWDVRVDAVRTLGFLGWREAVPLLRRQLDRKEDWRAVSAACLALGRLGAEVALPDLDRVAQRFWYPPVRRAAAFVAAVLRRDLSAPGQEAWEKTLDGLPVPRPEGVDPGPPALALADEGELTGADLEAQAYPPPPEETEDPPGLRVPTCGLRTGAGFLLGSNRGEWGGELVYRVGSKVHFLVLDTIHGLHHLDGRVVAVAGLAHMGLDRGRVYRVSLGETPRAEPWITLPGAPWDSVILPNGNLHVTCEAGYLEIPPSGEIRFTAAGLR